MSKTKELPLCTVSGDVGKSRTYQKLMTNFFVPFEVKIEKEAFLILVVVTVSWMAFHLLAYTFFQCFSKT